MNPIPEIIADQCHATLKSGARCNNKTKHESRRCYIHQHRIVVEWHPRRLGKSLALKNKIKDKLRERDGDNCGICGEPLFGSRDEAPCLDHIVPLAQGGEDTIENLQLAHPYCNLRKGARC